MIGDVQIELTMEKIKTDSDIKFPSKIRLIGKIEKDDVRIYISNDVYNNLEKLSVTDIENELGSILIGDYCFKEGKMNIIISDYIEAKYTDNSAYTLKFNHKTWNYIHDEFERLHKNKKIIGWQHTHPDYGIFLSSYDMFIQENFFNLPFQVAYVIDPVRKIRGFFQWKNGKVEILNGFYIYCDLE